MSWVARSITTPTSAIRCGNGPCRRVTTWKTSPSSPFSSRLRRLCSAGLYRSMWPTPATRPRGLERLDQPARRLDRLRQRLLDQRVHAGVGQLAGRPARAARSGRPPRRSRCPARAARSSVGHHRDAVRRPVASPAGSTTPTSSTPSSPDEHPGVVAAHRAQADQAGAQPAAARSSVTATALTRRRRSGPARAGVSDGCTGSESTSRGGALGLRQLPRPELAVLGQVRAAAGGSASGSRPRCRRPARSGALRTRPGRRGPGPCTGDRRAGRPRPPAG